MSRTAVGAFTALAIATIGAFFVTQHLKVSTPLIAGYPAPVPSVINPVSGGTCRVANPKGRLVPVSFRRTAVSFYLVNRADDVTVSVIDAAGRVVRVLPGSGGYLTTYRRRRFVWNGRLTDGSVAPDGAYDLRVTLAQQDRSLLIANQSTGAPEPVTVQSHPVPLRVTRITPGEVAVPGRSRVTIRFAGNQGIRPRILIFRSGGTRPLKNYAATTRGATSVWNGTLAGGRPAPPGRYEVVLALVNPTCNRVRSPRAAPSATVTVR